MPLPYKSSSYVPKYRSTKVFVESSSLPSRQAEIVAQQQTDHVSLRIAEESRQRYKNARKLVTIVNSNKVPRGDRQ
jgi:hypothetical protein